MNTTSTPETSAEVSGRAVAENTTPVIAVIGNPNTGKSTVFNALTGLRQKIANFPGVTVEKHVGTLRLPGGDIQLVDLPGTYSMAPHSPDEMVSIDVLGGRIHDVAAPSAILVVVDASNLQRNMYLVSQLLELGVPVVVGLNMSDVARTRGIEIDVRSLESHLQARVVPLVAAEGKGIERLRDVLVDAIQHPETSSYVALPEVKQAAHALAVELQAANVEVTEYEAERALIDTEGYAEQRLVELAGDDIHTQLADVRATLAPEGQLAQRDIKQRYAWIQEVLDEVMVQRPQTISWVDRVDGFLSHPLIGSLLFLTVMAVVFQAVFAWTAPMMDMIDAAAAVSAAAITSWLPDGALSSLLTDGVIAGVGSVIIFLPQILVLSAFIIVLEDTGYMARAAFLIDRLMRWCGLSGQSFIPMLSSYACAVPGIMATRVIPDRRDRFATILAAPFMTCSARLPVYALLIAAFVPQQQYVFGLLNLQGLVLLALYLLGIFGGIFTAWLLKRTALRGPTPTFLMELPPYRMPNLKSVLIRLLERARIFLTRAGTVIFTVAVIVWALAYFPHPTSLHDTYEQQRVAAASLPDDAAREQQLVLIDNQEAAAYLDQSLLGRLGKTVEPAFKPLGWDWKVSAAVIASFPAREVVIAVLGTIYAVGADVDEADSNLRSRIQSASWPDGSPVFTLPMVFGLMVFYAFCLQCVATVVIIRRETNSWRWPVFAWVYMTGFGYLAALITYQIGSRL